MTITTEEIELLAKTHDLVRFTLGMKAPEHDLTSAALRSLAAERDALRANLDAIVIPTTYYMDPPDGGDVSIAEQVRRMYRHVCDLQAENARLRKLLQSVLNACDKGRMVERGAGGMTVDAQIRRSFYYGVPAWPIEEARAELGETQ
jgi:hypothetical protein